MFKKRTDYVYKKCIRCERRKQKHRPEDDLCIRCLINETRRAAVDDAERAKVLERVRRYRERRKLDGKPDKTIPKPKPKAPRTEPAPKPKPAPALPVMTPDAIATASSAAKLTPRERRQLTVQEAMEIELIRRELARRKLMHFVKRRNPKYMAGWVHEDICERLDKFSADVAAGLSPRLMLFMPPRHGKSKLCSQEFPAHHMGQYPDHEVISSSYSAPLAMDFSRKVQEIVESEDYELLFDMRLKPDARSIEKWDTTGSGSYTAAGVGGPITGRGAHVLIIDDPVKNREEAESPGQRQIIKDWYTSTAYTRLMPGGGVLIIQTRWHDDDLAGWLIAQMQEAEKQFAETGEWPEDVDRWEVVSYPAIAIEDEKRRKKGEALHPQRYPLSALRKIKKTLGDRDWNALYQQNPVPETGAYFLKDTIRRFSGAAPTGISIIAAGDLAISKEDSANHTVIIVAGVDEKDDLFILDARRGKMGSNEIIDELIDVYRTWRPQLIGIEKTHVEQSIGPFLEKRIREERLWSMAVEPLVIGKRDKQLRARPIQGRMKQGKVYFPEGAPWMAWLENELLRFPAGSSDDGVDALAWIGQMMNMVSYVPPPKAKLKSWKDRLNSLTSATAAKFKNPAMAA